MAKHDLNLAEFARRLGLKERTGLELGERLQPVVTVADTSHLVPAIAPPASLVGGNTGLVALQFARFQVQSLAPGGTIVGFVSFVANTPSATPRVFVLEPGPLPGFDTGPVVHPHSRVGRQPSAALVQSGNSIVALGSGVVPQFGQSDFVPGPIWIDRGSVLVVENNVVADRIVVAMFLQDIPVGEMPTV